MRKTDLSFGELLVWLKKAEPCYPCYLECPIINEKGETCYPKCLIVNEIGEVCEAGDKEAKEAEDVLRGLLDSGDPRDRLTAFCYLSVTENINQETALKLEEFKGNPDNEEVLEEAKRLIEEYWEVHN